VGHGLRIIGLLAVLSLLAACRGAADAEPLSTKQYVTRGQAICRDVQHQLDAVGKQLRAEPTPAALGGVAHSSAEAVGAVVDRLELLPEPIHLSFTADRLSRGLLRQERLLDRVATAVERHDSRALRSMPARLRRNEAIVTALARSIGLTACGSRDEARTPSRVTRRELEAAKPRMRPNAGDVAQARSLLVRDSDLWSNFGPDPSKRASPNIPRCPGLYAPDRSAVTITGSAESDFTNGGDGIASRAALFRSEDDLDAYWRAIVRPAYAQCLAEVWDASPRPGGKAKILQVRSFPLEAGVEHVAAYRTVVRKTRGDVSVDVYRTVLFLAHGRAMVNVQVFGAGHPCDCWPALAMDASRRLLAVS
jgi:hypothetical protein